MQDIANKLKSLYDRIPKGEYRDEIAAIIKELEKPAEVKDEYDTEETKSGPIKVPKSKKAGKS